MKDEEKKIKSTFDYQIYKAERIGKSYFIQEAILDKSIWELSKDLTIEDWRKIRTGDYWQIRDNLKGIEQKQFLKNCLNKYYRSK